jgi:hypothetical protein
MSDMYIDQRGVVVERVMGGAIGTKCAHCCYGKYIYEEEYNGHKRPLKAVDICKKYRPADSNCKPTWVNGAEIYWEVKDE